MGSFDNHDLSNLCRLCLCENRNIRLICENQQTSSKNWIYQDLSRVIFECINIQICERDGPTGICSDCLWELMQILRFRSKCEKVDHYLKEQYFGQHTVSFQNDKHSLAAFIDLGDELSIVKNKMTLDLDSIKEANEIPEVPKCVQKKSINNIAVKYSYKLKSGSKRNHQTRTNSTKLTKRDVSPKKAYHGLCHICGKEYRHLWVHFQSHSKVPSFACEICGKTFKSKVYFELHSLTHKKAEWPCQICSKLYRTRMRLKRHMRIHTDDRPFFCQTCEKRFYTKYNLEVHMRMHTGDKPFRCKHCNECFAHTFSLKIHNKKVHSLELINNTNIK